MDLFILRCWMCAQDACLDYEDGMAICSRFRPCPGLVCYLQRHPASVPAMERILNEN